MTTHTTPLDAKVGARNEANATAAKLHRDLIPILKPFIGKKIQNADGSFFHKFKEALPHFDSGFPDINIYCSYSTLKARVKSCHHNPSRTGDCHHAQYAEQIVYLGSIASDNTLESIYENPAVHKDNWTSAQVIEARRQLTKAKEQVSAAQAKLGDFGEHDLC